MYNILRLMTMVLHKDNIVLPDGFTFYHCRKDRNNYSSET